MDPACWDPDIADISAYQRADLVMLNGAAYAKWVGRVRLPPSKIVDTSRHYKDCHTTTQQTMTHSHGAAGEHAHEALAFTTWLDFELAARQAEAMAAVMGRRRLNLRDTFRKNFEDLRRAFPEIDYLN